MDERRRRLRRHLRNVGRRRPRSKVADTQGNPSTGFGSPLGEGYERVTPWGPTFVREVHYPLDHPHGNYPVGYLWEVASCCLADLFSPTPAEPPLCQELRFIDIETTGIIPGAGVIAFMVGIGGITDEEVWVRQYFLRDLHEEPAMLYALVEELETAQGFVTYNGEMFDLPILDSRLLQNNFVVSLLLRPHLDLLHHTRRIWRPRLGRVPLSAIEHHILGYERKGPDVPGKLVPWLYEMYLSTGEEKTLTGIFYHNEKDILSLIVLTGIIQRCRHEPWSEPAMTAEDLIAHARHLFRRGHMAEARTSLQHALERSRTPELRHQAYVELCRILKRMQAWSEFISICQRWAEEWPVPDLTPFEELAKYYEHRCRDWRTALMWVARAEALLPRLGPAARARWHDALARRRQRLTRRLQKEDHP